MGQTTYHLGIQGQGNDQDQEEDRSGDGVMTLLPTWDLHGLEMQETENSGRIMKRAMSNNGRT